MTNECGYGLYDRALVEGRDPFFLQARLDLRPTFLALHLSYLWEENDDSKRD